MIFVCPQCRVCKQQAKIEIADKKYVRWRINGELIQDVFPELSSSHRELMISGTHSECFDRLFAEVEKRGQLPEDLRERGKDG